MLHINDLFSKFKSAFASHEAKKAIVIAACETRARVALSTDQIEIKDGVVKLNVSPMVRSVVFMKKGELIAEINKSLKPPVRDIR